MASRPRRSTRRRSRRPPSSSRHSRRSNSRIGSRARRNGLPPAKSRPFILRRLLLPGGTPRGTEEIEQSVGVDAVTSLSHLLENNRAWAAEMVRQDPDFFQRLVGQQAPQFLWIGCSDSRVPANQIVGM